MGHFGSCIPEIPDSQRVTEYLHEKQVLSNTEGIVASS